MNVGKRSTSHWTVVSLSNPRSLTVSVITVLLAPRLLCSSLCLVSAMSADSTPHATGVSPTVERNDEHKQQKLHGAEEDEVDVDDNSSEEKKGRVGQTTADERKRAANKRKKEKAKQRKQQQRQQPVDSEMSQLAASFSSLAMQRYFQPPLSLAFNPREGRHLLLSSSLPAHTLLFSQLPYAAVLTDAHSDAVCHRCMSSAAVLLKCSVCQFAHYCSSTCKRAHEKLHAVECGLMNGMKRRQGNTTRIRLMMRILLQKREEDELVAKHREKMQAGRKRESSSSSTSISLPSTLQVGQTFSDVDGLQSHYNDLDAQDRLEMLTLFASMRSGLGAPFDELGDDELMLRVQCIIKVNAHFITSVNKEKLALGLYTAPSLMNHSCLPSAFYYFTERGEMNMRLLADTAAGGELTYAYTDLYQRRSDRWHVLKEIYHVHDGCQCVRCSVPMDGSWGPLH